MTPVPLCANPLLQIPMVGKPLTDAGGNFVNLIKGGANFNEWLDSKRVTLVMPLHSTAAKNFFSKGEGNCTFAKRSGGNFSLVYKNSNVFFY